MQVSGGFRVHDYMMKIRTVHVTNSPDQRARFADQTRVLPRSVAENASREQPDAGSSTRERSHGYVPDYARKTTPCHWDSSQRGLQQQYRKNLRIGQIGIHYIRTSDGRALHHAQKYSQSVQRARNRAMMNEECPGKLRSFIQHRPLELQHRTIRTMLCQIASNLTRSVPTPYAPIRPCCCICCKKRQQIGMVQIVCCHLMQQPCIDAIDTQVAAGCDRAIAALLPPKNFALVFSPAAACATRLRIAGSRRTTGRTMLREPSSRPPAPEEGCHISSRQ